MKHEPPSTLMLRPILTNVQFHPSYAVHIDSTTETYRPSMTAIDTEGRVWWTWCSSNGGWRPWEAIVEFVNPDA